MGAIGEKSASGIVDPARLLADLQNPALVSAIDLARWLAAFMVMIGHARFPLLKGYGQLTAEQTPLWVKGWYFVTGYFVEAVLVFFVLSGFLVGGMVCARLAGGSFDPAGYAIDRFSRLYTAFLPALALTVVLTLIGATWFNGTGLYDGTHPTFAEKGTAIDFIANSGFDTLIGNAAMLQFYFVEPYGANPPLWTLSSEFWFYAVFGLGAAGLMKSGSIRLALIGLAALASVLLGPMFWLYFGMWLVGVTAAVLRPPMLRIAGPALALLAGLLLLRRYADAVLEPGEGLRFAMQYGICLATGLVLLGWRQNPPRWAVSMAGFNKAMADFSYSLYLTHFPVIILLIAILGKLTGAAGFAGGFPPTAPLALASYVAAVMIALGLAYLFAQCTERQTGKVRAWLKSWRASVARPET